MKGFKALPSAGLLGRRPRSHCQVTPPPTDGIVLAVGAGRNSEGPESGLEDSANSTVNRISKISKFRLVRVGNHNFENFENHWAPAHFKVFKVSPSASAPGGGDRRHGIARATTFAKGAGSPPPRPPSETLKT